jgi:hypothetical protein
VPAANRTVSAWNECLNAEHRRGMAPGLKAP